MFREREARMPDGLVFVNRAGGGAGIEPGWRRLHLPAVGQLVSAICQLRGDGICTHLDEILKRSTRPVLRHPLGQGVLCCVRKRAIGGSEFHHRLLVGADVLGLGVEQFDRSRCAVAHIKGLPCEEGPYPCKLIQPRVGSCLEEPRVGMRVG